MSARSPNPSSAPGDALQVPPRAGITYGLLRFLHQHPVVALAILTPGIVEYLSTSSPILLLVVSPPAFFLFLAVNVGQYTAGALLVREAQLRWQKGWLSVAVLGLAYGITEEGLGDNTLFRNTQHADGVLGWYGHFLGVNWVWSVGVLTLHIVISIGLPILVLGLALPETRGRSMLGPRGIGFALLSVAAATGFECWVVARLYGFWMGTPLFVATLIVIASLVYVAFRLPRSLLRPASERPSASPAAMFVAGAAFFPVALVLEYGPAAYDVPPLLAILVELAVLAAVAEWVRRHLGRSGEEYHLVHLAFGLVVWEAAFGVLLTLGLPYTLPLVAVALVFFIRLRRQYSPTRTRPVPPPGALGGSGELFG